MSGGSMEALDHGDGAARSCLALPEDLLGRLVPSLVPVSEVELADLRAARGRVLATDLVAARPVPDFARSAVDGYALRAEDLAGKDAPVLVLRGRVAAGDSGLEAAPGPGAVRIFTGAPLPPGCDRVAMQEDCLESAGHIVVRHLPAPGANVRLPGDDLAAGTMAVRAGTQLDPRHLAAAATLGLARVPVRRRLHVAVLSTGSELVEPGLPLTPGTIHNSNRFLITGILEAAGFEVLILPTAADDPATVRAALLQATDCDALVSSGGMSVGEEDHLRPALTDIGGRIDQWRLAIKPGKPVAVGRLPGQARNGALFLGLPGNPNAVLVTLMILALPLLRVLSGQPYRPLGTRPVRAAHSFVHKKGRREYVPVMLNPGPDGIAVARRLGHGGSGQQSAMVGADALMIIPDKCADTAAGDLFDAITLNLS